MNINELLTAYKTDMHIRNLSNQTITNYYNTLKIFKVWLQEQGITEIEEVTTSTLKQYVVFLQNEGKKATYINTTIKKLKAFYKYLEEEFELKNLMKKVKQLKTEKIVVQTFDLNYAKIISKSTGNNYLSMRNDTIIVALLETGVRVGELCNIKMDDISLQQLLIHGKGAKQRYVPISKTLRKALNKYLPVRKNYLQKKKISCDYLFVSSHEKQVSLITIEKMIQSRCKKMNLPYFSCHKYRHYFTRKLLLNGIDVYTVSKLLGHESITITQQYLNGLSIEQLIPNVLQVLNK